jgi:hypothetical protein
MIIISLAAARFLEARVVLECMGKLLVALVNWLRRSRWLPESCSIAGQQQAYPGTGT